MIRSRESDALRRLALEHGYEPNIAAKIYAGHHDSQDWQFRFLLRHGLKPSHDFLDIGCGWLRLAYVLLPYLESGRYHGIDSFERNLAMGRAWLAEMGQPPPEHLLLDDGFAFERFGRRFDFAFCHAVFTHLNHAQIEECLTRLVGVMKPAGVAYCTYYASDADRDDEAEYRLDGDRKIVRYSIARVSRGFLDGLSERLGVTCAHLGREGHPTGHDVLELRFAPPPNRRPVFRRSGS